MEQIQFLLGHVSVPARSSINKALAAADEAHHRELDMMASIAAIHIFAASGNSEEEGAAAGRLIKLVADATAAGFVNTAMEARLALGETEMISGDRAAGLAQLEALERDATAGGYGLFAQKAAAARISKEAAQTRKRL